MVEGNRQGEIQWLVKEVVKGFEGIRMNDEREAFIEQEDEGVKSKNSVVRILVMGILE